MKIKFPIKLILAGFAAFLVSAGANSAFAAPRHDAVQHRVAKPTPKAKAQKAQKARHAKHAKHHQKKRGPRDGCERGRRAHHVKKSEPVLVKRTVRLPGNRRVVTYRR